MLEETARIDMKPATMSCVCAVAFSVCLCISPVHATEKTTPDVSSPSPSQLFFAAGDIADCRGVSPQESAANKTANLLASQIKTHREYKILLPGDTTYPVGLPAEFHQCYEPTWGRFKQHTYPAPGNHEYYSPLAYGYHRYFGKQAGSQKKPYYSFNSGNWHIISLDSNLRDGDFDRQLDWLSSDLKKNRQSCILAFWHHPLYSSGIHGNSGFMKPVWEKLYRAGADIVLSGHDHHYERFAPQDAEGNTDSVYGIRQFVVGTGGARLTPTFRQKPNSETIAEKTFGILKLELRHNNYSWQFMPTEGSSYTDSGTGQCHAKPQSK